MFGTAKTYQPINTLKPIAENIWIVDGPLITFKHMPFTTRMTVIRLAGGELFIHSPTPLSDDLKSSIDKLGDVRYIISPNRIHYWWVGEWGKAYPEATKWASPKVRPSAQEQGFDFDRDLTDAPDTAWANDIDQVIARGGRFMEEVIFFHKTSKTLILADMIENFESSKLPYWIRPFAKMGGVLSPNGSTPRDLRLTYWGHHQQMQKALDRITDWQPQTIIMAHGKIITENAEDRLKKAFRWV